ncbi:MAG: radical SAM protein, partial [Bacteroidetes bacterium]|nr:radical SAM protein [Bacteroidota bacterium]
EDIKEMLDFGCTRVEIGVQMPDDELYRKTNRGHTVQDVVDATKNLKNAGFKLGYHIMPGLPGSNPEKDLKMFKEIFNLDSFKPDQLKIYPCQVVDDSPLAKTYKIIKFKPYNEEQTKKILFEMMKIIPEYCRVMRIMREFPKEKLIDGLTRLDLRKKIEKNFRESGEKINECGGVINVNGDTGLTRIDLFTPFTNKGTINLFGGSSSLSGSIFFTTTIDNSGTINENPGTGVNSGILLVATSPSGTGVVNDLPNLCIEGPIIIPLADITVIATDPSGAVVNYPAAIASDDIDGVITPVCSPASGSTFAITTTTVTCTAVDTHGNVGTASFTVTVVILAGDLFGIAGQSGGASTLYSIDINSGAATPVGPIGFNNCEGLDVDDLGTFYATCIRPGTTVNVLITIDPSTAAVTEVGATGLTNRFDFPKDISFRNSDGKLFGMTFDCGPSFPTSGFGLMEIDVNTGLATTFPGFGRCAGGNGLAFSSDDILYLYDEFSFNTVNQITGAVNFIAPNDGGGVSKASAMDFNPDDGLLYASKTPSDFGNRLRDLATVNLATGVFTIIGPTVNGLTALAFNPSIAPELPVTLPPDVTGDVVTDPDGTTTITVSDDLGNPFTEIILSPGSSTTGTVEIIIDTSGVNNAVEITGVTLPLGQTKSIQLASNPSNSPKACVTDSPASVFAQSNPGCDDSDPFTEKLTCDGVERSFTFPDGPRNFTCTVLNGTMRVEGLKHSVVAGFEDISWNITVDGIAQDLVAEEISPGVENKLTVSYDAVA